MPPNSKEIRHDGPTVSPTAPLPDSNEEIPGWLSFFSSRTLVCNAIGYFAFLYVTFLLPLHGRQSTCQNQFHYSLSSLSYVGVIPWLGSCLAVLIGGRLSDLILTKTGDLRIARSQFKAACLPVACWACAFC